MTITPVDKISEEKFLAYRSVQMSGKYNMLMEADKAMKMSGLKAPDYWSIINHYPKLYRKFIGKTN